MPFIKSSDDHDVRYYSSSNQHQNKLSVLVNNVWKPIVFDSVDYIDCDKVKSHKVCVTDKEDIGYVFPVAECVYTDDTYITHDHHATEYEVLNEWFGEGVYQVAVDKKAFVNFDNGALGIRNITKLRIGLSYALADNTLPAAE